MLPSASLTRDKPGTRNITSHNNTRADPTKQFHATKVIFLPELSTQMTSEM